MLNRLGFGPCDPARQMLQRPGHLDAWLRACRGGPIDLRAVFTGFRATTDAPACFFWRELVAEFPAARVIVSVRDPADWCSSMRRTVLRDDLFAGDDPTLTALRALSAARFRRAFGERLDEPGLPAGYHRHLAEVRAAIPADRLLVYDVRDGWPPLCGFLGIPVPAEDFPWLNTTGEFVGKLCDHRGESASG